MKTSLGSVILRTCPDVEGRSFICQLGTSNAEEALNAARMIEVSIMFPFNLKCFVRVNVNSSYLLT